MSYTHIVVGAGSAGCVVTSRIAENANYNVLLIEAGPDNKSISAGGDNGIRNARRVPMKGQSDIFEARIDWGVPVVVPGGETMCVPQAKIVGGGSSINGGTALRNTRQDSNEWVALGNDAWDFESVCKAYEILGDKGQIEKPGIHPIVLTGRTKAGRIQEAFLKGAESNGMHWVEDIDEIGAEGCGSSPVCRRGSTRISAANTFLDPFRERGNITILTNSQVDRLWIEGNTIHGVQLINGKVITATHEVILSAGAIFSPAILQRSGIGPKQLLSRLEIDIISDLPVGENLSDHPCIPVVARPRPDAYFADDYSLQMQARWSSISHEGAIDLQMVCFSYLYLQDDPQMKQRSIGGTAHGHVAGIGCNVNKPTSLGSVFIRDKNGESYPEVDPHYLETDHDIDTAREVVRRAFAVISSAPMQGVLDAPIGIDQQLVENNLRLDEYIRSQFSSTYHFCGSCRMAVGEKGGVVDQSGRVYGTKALRVCDASVLPTVPSANTMWTTMMFAHRIGCSIRDQRDVV